VKAEEAVGKTIGGVRLPPESSRTLTCGGKCRQGRIREGKCGSDHLQKITFSPEGGFLAPRKKSQGDGEQRARGEVADRTRLRLRDA